MFKFLLRQIHRNRHYVKFLISGFSAFSTQFICLFVFTEFFHIWYLISTVLAFIVAFVVSFSLQKFWTFRDNNKEKIFSQLSLYLLNGVFGLFVNTSVMYFFVDIINVHYLFSQFIASGLVSFFNYIIYRFVIFRDHQIPTKKINKTLKTLLISTGIFPPDIGGPATYSKILYEELPKRGFRVKLICYSDSADFDNDIIRVKRDGGAIKRYWRFIKKIWRIAPDADVVYCQDPVSVGLPTAIVCFLQGRNYILKVVGDYAWEQGKNIYKIKENLDDFQDHKYNFKIELWRRLQKIVAKNAKFVIVPSKYLKSIVSKWGVDQDKIIVIYNAVRRASTSIGKGEAKEKHDIRGNTIVSVGRLVPWKGFEVLIDAIRGLLEFDSNFNLIIAGDGPDNEKIKQKIKDLKLEKSIRMLGNLEQESLWEIMKASDYFVLNTGYEGLPHIIIEAMMLGLPIITTDAGGNTEVVSHGENGLIIEYNNREAIKNAIIKLYQDKEYTENLIKNASEKLERYNKNKMLSGLIEVLNKQ